MLLSIDPFIVEFSQYWRVITFQLLVVNESDYMLITILWFNFKTLERFFGSRKYLSVIVLFAIYNAVITFLVLALGQLLLVGVAAIFRLVVLRQQFTVLYTDTIFNTVALGPFGLISLLYMCHGAYIPVSYHFKILMKKPKADESEDSEPHNTGSTLTLTNHFQIHVLFTILMLNNGFASLIPCLVGLLVGRLYTQDLLAGSKNWVLPLLVFRLFVSPRKLQRSATRTLQHRFHQYQLVSEEIPAEQTPVVEEEVPERHDEEDTEVALDDIRSNDETQEDRSATPVRPLGRQFLDTFRA